MLQTYADTSSLTLADLLKELGDISPSRIRYKPPPGTATEQDVIDIHRREKRLFELVDGVLVEKIMGYAESSIAARLLILLGKFVDENDLGNLASPDGTMRLMPGLVRIPDVSFVSWEHLPNRQIPTEDIPNLSPDLAVEILSKGNTKAEMDLKVRDYFHSGTKLVWLVDLRNRSVRVYTSPDKSKFVTEDQSLNGGDVLPGFKLPLRQVFARLPRSSSRKPSARGKKKPPRATT